MVILPSEPSCEAYITLSVVIYPSISTCVAPAATAAFIPLAEFSFLIFGNPLCATLKLVRVIIFLLKDLIALYAAEKSPVTTSCAPLAKQS